MRAVTWQGRRKVSVDTVPDPAIKEPNDAIIRVTSTNICGSDLHLYEVLGAFMSPGDILGHEAMGVVEEVGREVDELDVGDRVVIPFNISLRDAASCATTGCRANARRRRTAIRARAPRSSVTPSSTARSRAGRPSICGFRRRSTRTSRCRTKDPTSGMSTCPTYCQRRGRRVEYAEVPDGGTLVVLGLGPIGSMACRIASHRKNCRVIGVDLVDERLNRARDYCTDVIDLRKRRRRRRREGPHRRTRRRRGDRRGRHGGTRVAGRRGRADRQRIPAVAGRPRVMKHAGVDRLAAFNMAISLVRRGGTISLSGVYGGAADPINMMTLFDKQIQLRMGQANVKKWIPDIMPLLTDDGSARRRAVRHPPAAARGCARRVRDVPEEGGRHGQGGPHALT